jgi:hypothetical protein
MSADFDSFDAVFWDAKGAIAQFLMH